MADPDHHTTDMEGRDLAADSVPHPSQDITASVAVMSHQIGEVKSAVERTHSEMTRQLDDHGKRIGALEEAGIRADEREQTEERLRRLLKEERVEVEQMDTARAGVNLARWQVWMAALAAVAAVAYVVVTLLPHN